MNDIKTKWSDVLTVTFRILLAAFGGYATTVLLSAAVSEIASVYLEINKAELLMWMLILSFLIYSALAIWVIATRHLKRTSAILIILNLAMYTLLTQGV